MFLIALRPGYLRCRKIPDPFRLSMRNLPMYYTRREPKRGMTLTHRNTTPGRDLIQLTPTQRRVASCTTMPYTTTVHSFLPAKAPLFPENTGRGWGRRVYSHHRVVSSTRYRHFLPAFTQLISPGKPRQSPPSRTPNAWQAPCGSSASPTSAQAVERKREKHRIQPPSPPPVGAHEWWKAKDGTRKRAQAGTHARSKKQPVALHRR